MLTLERSVSTAAGRPTSTGVAPAAVRRVELDLITNTLTVEFAPPSPPMTTVFTDSEAADAAFTKLWRRLGDGFGLKQRQPDAWEAARLPVAAMGGVLAATLAIALTATAVADGDPAAGWRAVLAADWRWVGGLGGVALAALQVWLYRRLTKPPVMLELIPK